MYNFFCMNHQSEDSFYDEPNSIATMRPNCVALFNTLFSIEHKKSIIKKVGFFTLFLLLFNSFSFSQALGTDPEKGRGTYKNRTFFNLERYWDTAKVCSNPHKGWSVHYFSNSISNYGNHLAPNDSLPDFPGLNDIYFRLAWSYLEPKEGVYNWTLIDTLIQKWIKWGHTVSFRITCKETNIVYATPEWVRLAGAKGTFVNHPDLKIKAWAPDYDDPVFMQKLNNFHKAFAKRYDGKPWVEYVDIGSLGDWGEAHTAYSGWKDIPVEILKQHIDMYKRWYKKTTLIISDDAIGQRDTDDGSDYIIFDYALKNGIGFRDDSGNVKWYKTLGFGPSCIRTPELFSATYKKLPVVLESDHYGDVVEGNMWINGEGLLKAVYETHASLVGFHYYPREWLKENYDYAKKITNIAGYWYFPKFAMLPDTLRKNSEHNYLRLTWENHGVAPAYHRFILSVALISKSGGKRFVQELTGSDCRNWLPGEIIAEQHPLTINKNMQPGIYGIAIGLRDECGFHNKAIELPMKDSRKLEGGLYKIGEIVIN